MQTAIRPFLARLISPVIVTLFAWLAVKLGLVVDESLVSQTTEVVVNIVIWVVGGMLMAYGWLHKFINKWVNPADVAAPEASPVPPKRL